MQTCGDIVARLTARCTRLDLVGENADQRRAESGGEFSVSESYLDLLAALVRVSGIKRHEVSIQQIERFWSASQRRVVSTVPVWNSGRLSSSRPPPIARNSTAA